MKQDKDTYLVDIDSIKPNSKNTKPHSKEFIDRLQATIERFGFVGAIDVARNIGNQKDINIICAGHARWQAAKQAGYTQIRACFQDFHDWGHFHAVAIVKNESAKVDNTDMGIVNALMPDFGPEITMEDLYLDNFSIDPADKKKKKEKMCPHCGVVI